MKVLYVTRKFPPSVGGLETAAFGLYSSMNKICSLKLIKWGGSNKALPIIYPWLTIKTILLGWIFRPDVIYLQDGVLAPLGYIAKLLTRRPVVISLHGLDITYKNKLYRFSAKASMPKIDIVVVGSRWTREKALERYPDKVIKTVTYGLNDEFKLSASKDQLIERLSKEINLPLKGNKILVTTGRLVERKGVEWFVLNVMPSITTKLPKTIYLVAGDGPKKQDIKNAISKFGISSKVKMLGKVNNETRDLLYNAADLFIMPNIPIAGDGEGFGLVAVEASSCGTPVIGAELEGIKDAVKSGNGKLIKPLEPQQFADVIIKELKSPSFNRSAVRNYVLENFSWDKVAENYLEIFQSLKR